MQEEPDVLLEILLGSRLLLARSAGWARNCQSLLASTGRSKSLEQEGGAKPAIAEPSKIGPGILHHCPDVNNLQKNANVFVVFVAPLMLKDCEWLGIQPQKINLFSRLLILRLLKGTYQY